MLINEMKEQDGFEIFLRGHRDGKTLLRSYVSCQRYCRVWECLELLIRD